MNIIIICLIFVVFIYILNSDKKNKLNKLKIKNLTVNPNSQYSFKHNYIKSLNPQKITNQGPYFHKPNSKNFPINHNNTLLPIETKNKDKCNKNLLTGYECFLSKCDLCPMSSYKQCSNNYSYKTFPPNVNCNCDNRAYELCNIQNSQRCLLANKICNNWQKKDLEKKINYPIFYPRVNMYNAANTKFKPFNLKTIPFRSCVYNG